jgi:DNA polymerase III subunit gamma/tau
MAWYNKYRPQSFAEVSGQDLVKSVLQNALKKNRIKHAYLFSGPKGVGKTTIARIFAGQLNDLKENPEAKIDIIEMDAASNTSIEDIRQLTESAKNPPISGKYKIYIIDEVHMLSKAAMNALLKILEEPPTYLVFMLATTNPEKLIPTVLSRLTKLNLTNHTVQDIFTRLRQIADEEKVSIDDDSLQLIAKRAEGGQRDAINLLETVASYELDNYNLDTVARLLGLLPEDLLENLTKELLKTDFATVQADLVTQLESKGVDGETFLVQFLDYLLEQSFAGKEEVGPLIEPVSSVLSLNLPLSSVISALAIIQVKIKEKTQDSPVKKKQTSDLTGFRETKIDYQPSQKGEESETKSKTDLHEKTEESFQETAKNVETTETQDIKETGDNSQKESEPQEEPQKNYTAENQESNEKVPTEKPRENAKTEPQNNMNYSKNASINPGQITSDKDLLSFLSSLPGKTDCPPALKMFIQDLRVEIDKQKPAEITLSVSCSIFQTTLKSQKLNSWLKVQLQENFDQEFVINTKIRQDKESEEVSYADSENSEVYQSETPDNESYFEEEIKPIEKKEAKKNQHNQKDLSPIEEGEIFYKVYKKLPENIQNSGVPIYSETIPAPEGGHQHWDKHAEEMFEFEEE